MSAEKIKMSTEAISTPRKWPEVLLKLYKRLLSPFLPASCRYVPTCSEYAAEALTRYGILRGSAMAFWRLLRCNPFVRGGYDPVPKNPVSKNDAPNKELRTTL
jgi:putative membrane protein insertion efficiency factor